MTGQGIRQHEYQSGKPGRRQSGCSACWIGVSSPVCPTTILREPLKKAPERAENAIQRIRLDTYVGNNRTRGPFPKRSSRSGFALVAATG